MKRLVILIGLLFVSCDYFDNKKVTSQDIIKQELQTINWSEVDEYPSFSECDTISEKQERKFCFETTMLKYVNTYLSQQHIVVSEDIEDTIKIRLAISNAGKINVLDINAKPETLEIIPEIDSLLRGSINALPKIFPAIKRGQQVHTEFVLPVVISIQ